MDAGYIYSLLTDYLQFMKIDMSQVESMIKLIVRNLKKK